MGFSKSEMDVLYLHMYYSVRYREHSGLSEKILEFKEGNSDAVEYFASEMIDAMKEMYADQTGLLSDALVCIMPSHIEGKYSEGLISLARKVCSAFNMRSAIYLIRRTKTHKSKATGGSRELDLMLDSLDINPGISVTGKTILVLDDVTTTGNSMEAARTLLKNAGASRILTQTIGRTMRGTSKIDYVLSYPGFDVNVEIQSPKAMDSHDITGAKNVLKKVFGYDSFKTGQENVIGAILSGRDVLAVMPTGAGKSICYQVPALLMGGITVVVSPLISLMQDQVKALNAAGVHAAYINSSLSDSQISAVFSHAISGEYKIIYVAPERLESSEFVSFAKEATISMVTVDEAHCISQWGQDFRPSYLKIIEFIKRLKNRPIVGAFTATATEEMRDDIITILNLNDPQVVISGYNRENLFFSVESGVMKDDFVLEYVEKHPNDSGIIYCSTRKSVDNLYEILLDKGCSVTRYHAGLSNDERKKNQDDFIYDNTSIVVATNAFGMGIDKSNVRYVIHYNMPQSMESYYQEAGRAGRDGIRSECIMLYSPQDVVTQRWLLDHKVFEDIEPDIIESIKERDDDRLRVMETYCKTTSCLRNYILKYFGEKVLEDCGDCANCLRDYKEIDLTKEAKSVANCIYETGGRFGLTIVEGTLLGANRARVREVGADRFKTYGALKSISRDLLRRLIFQMITDGYLAQTAGKYSVVKYGEHIDRLKDPSTRVIVKYFEPKKPRKTKTVKLHTNESGLDNLTKAGYDLYERLRTLRREVAREEAMPAYVIFNDKALLGMCLSLPQSKKEMLKVSGVGEVKYEKYGERFIEEIGKYIRENGKPTTDLTNQMDDEISTETEKKSKKNKKHKKRDFFLTPERAQLFEYSLNLELGEVRDMLNSIRDEAESRVTSKKKIKEFLIEEGLIEELQVDGVYITRPTELGLSRGITTVKKLSKIGTQYTDLAVSQEIQNEIVKHFTDNSFRYATTEDSESIESSFDRVAYNRSKNRPDGAGGSWTEEEDRKLDEEYNSGMKITDIAKMHSRTTGAIRARLRKHGIVL